MNSLVSRPRYTDHRAIPMDWTFRTILRGFLLVGGLAFVGFGAVEGTLFDLGIGIVAAVLGALGLWRERTERSEGRE